MPWEVSPFNSSVRRQLGGIWGEDKLPLTDWEFPEKRVILPSDLQRFIGIQVPVLRWDREKYLAVASQHRRDLHVIENVSAYLTGWECLGEETGTYAGHHRILFRGESRRWFAASIGELQGSYNIITVFGSSKPNFFDNRVRTLQHVVMREK